MPRLIRMTACLASLMLVGGACSQPSAEVLAAEQLIEEKLADQLDLVLDATCDEPDPPEVIACRATTPGGAEVQIVGQVGADELLLETLNVLTVEELPAVVSAFADSEAAAALPEGSLDCGSDSAVLDAMQQFACTFTSASERTVPVVVTVTTTSGGATFDFEATMGAEVSAEAVIERSILPTLGFAGTRATCADAGTGGEPFSCGALLADGRLLEFVAFEEDGAVQVAAANVLAPEELAKLDATFADTVAAAGVLVEGGRLDCGSDTVILDTTSSFRCLYTAPNQEPIDVTVTVAGLGTADASFTFDFAVVE